MVCFLRKHAKISPTAKSGFDEEKGFRGGVKISGLLDECVGLTPELIFFFAIC
jgi:hypothetical protein